MKRLILIFAVACAYAAQAQVVIEHGATMHLSRGTQMVLSSVSMEVEGELLCDTSTIVGLGGAGASRLSSPHTIALYSLRVDGDVEVSTDGLTCAGDVLMGTGILNLLHTTMQLRGSLLNENEAGYLTGGRVEKTLPAAGGGEKVSTGMGLSITPASSYENLPVARVHDRQHNRGEQSVARYYEFPAAVPLLGVDVAYLNACSPKPATDSYLLYHKAPQGWESLASETNLAGKRITSRLAEPVEVSLLAAFPFPELGYSQYITPNADGINDCFTVAGIEKFPDTRLVILLPNGSVIYDVSPYSNDFCGEGLSTGTYYYMFFTEKSDKKPVKRGFFELVKEE